MNDLPPLRRVCPRELKALQNRANLPKLNRTLLIRHRENLPPVREIKKSIPDFDKNLMEQLKKQEKERLAKQDENTEYDIYIPIDDSRNVDSELE